MTPTDPEQAAARVRLLLNESADTPFADDIRLLLAERDELRERLAANSGWAEDDEMARLREDAARLDWLEKNMSSWTYSADITPELLVDVEGHTWPTLREAIDRAARAAATPREG